MSKVKNKNTSPEKRVQLILKTAGYKTVYHPKLGRGNPDIYIPKYKTVIMVHGCFWHGHKCKKGALPKTNKKFWTQKIRTNVLRDKKFNAHLRKMGFSVLTIWGCSLERGTARVVKRLGVLKK